MSHIDIQIDASGAQRRLRRLDDGPDFQALLDFEGTLVEQFTATQLAVHIVTGSLQLSGKTDSDASGSGWRGEISYGGYAPGAIHPTVEYAQVEQDRAKRGKGGRGRRGIERDSSVPHQFSHDFMKPVYEDIWHRRYADAIEDFYRRTE